MRLWLIVILSGVITFAIRLSFILLMEHITVPDWFKRSLRYVPAAVLSAILVPEITTWNNTTDITWHNPQLLAGILAILVAWRTRNVVLTLAVGLVAFFAFNTFIH